MGYLYSNSPGGDKLGITGCEEHGGLIVTAHSANGKTAVPVCIAPEDVTEVMREMAAWAGLRYLAQEI